MWKCVVRGIRETLERRACRNVYSQSSQDNAKNEVKTNLTCQQKFLPPLFISCNKGFCGSTKNTGAEDKKHDNEWNTKHTWFEAVGWSSALAAGWVVCHTLCLRKRIFDGENNRGLRSKLYDYSGLSHLLTQLSNIQAKNIFPVTNCVGIDNKKSNLHDSNSQWTAEKAFGPITIEEAFKEAADDFSKTHKKVVGEYELHYGIKALEEKRYKDALTHFSTGAKLSSSSSMFNLGLCYELGIGTLVDQNKAAKYYNDAAAHNHADALYNLGVFHAQGRGGLPLNIDIARTYFTRAAKLGQVQAQHALDLEKSESQSKSNNISTVPNTHLENINLKKNKADNMRINLSDYVLKGNIADALSTNFITNSIHETPEYNEKTIEDPTQVFLDFLGLREPIQASIMVTNDYRVPC